MTFLSSMFVRGERLEKGDRVKVEKDGDEVVRIAKLPSSASTRSGGGGSDHNNIPPSRKRAVHQKEKEQEVIDLCSPPRKKTAVTVTVDDTDAPSSSSSPPPPSSVRRASSPPPSPSSSPHPPSPTPNARRPNKEYRNLHSALNHAWEMHGGWSLTKEQLKATCTVCKLPSSDCTNTEEVLTHLKKCGCHFIIGPK
uniref:Uncharacterized protein n=1 Tax=Pristionchus pacificus TaxID=54126 RepID=A0A8R1YBI7_PRIPA